MAFQNAAMLYRGFPAKLYHRVPDWVEPGALFHIRIAIDRDKPQRELTATPLAEALLDSACFYEEKAQWHITLFLLMPDHLPGFLSFPRDKSMGKVIGNWKHFHSRKHSVMWQQGIFDHRLRADERGEQLSMKMKYIRENPVVAGLCARAEDWPWVIENLRQGGSSSPLLDVKV